MTSAQTQEVRTSKVDSLVFVDSKKQLNNLNTTVFEKKTFKNSKVTIPYRLLIPRNNGKTQKFPLVITFHNSSKIGDDNEKQLEPLAKIWIREEIYTKYPCYVVAPQFNKRSSNYDYNVQASTPSNAVFEVLKLIKDLQKTYPNIDKKRIYLIGYSMGASTAQNLMTMKPNKFAALVSMAAVPDLSNLKRYKNKKIWLIHGALDFENPYSGSVALYKRLASTADIKFTTFTNLDHNKIIAPFLVTDEIPKWLFNAHL
jgi:predicted peptidase